MILTNRGRYILLNSYLRGVTPPTNIYAVLCSSAVSPDADTNTLADLTEIAAGNGYTSGGIQLSRNSTDFPSYGNESGEGYTYIEARDLAWTASGGSLATARWLVLTTDEATVSSRNVLAYGDIGDPVTASDGQELSLSGVRIALTYGAWTQSGIQAMLRYFFQGESAPTNFYAALCTSATAPTATTTTLGTLTQIGTSTGYTNGGLSNARGVTDFDVATEDDGDDEAFVEMVDQSWTASGGTLGPARYLVLTDDNGTVANRVVLAWLDLETDRSATTGNDLVIPGITFKCN